MVFVEMSLSYLKFLQRLFRDSSITLITYQQLATPAVFVLGVYWSVTIHCTQSFELEDKRGESSPLLSYQESEEHVSCKEWGSLD